jgi:hypothetical protein
MYVFYRMGYIRSQVDKQVRVVGLLLYKVLKLQCQMVRA